MLIDTMARELALPRSFLMRVAANASRRYRQIQVTKANGATRTVHHPSRVLKALQRWLNARVLSWLPVHEAARAYRPGCGILDNARPHAGGRYLLRMDLRRFFPSITRYDIRAYMEDHRTIFTAWSGEDDDFFLALVCRFSELSIGAPTSPALSNALCHELDSRLSAACAALRVRYTRYADDLFFSASEPGALPMIESSVASILGALPYPRGLVIQHCKTRRSSRKRRRVVTGLILTSEGGVSIGRRLKREIRSLVNRVGHLPIEERARLGGLLGHCGAIEPDFVQRLSKKYGHQKVLWALHPLDYSAKP